MYLRMLKLTYFRNYSELSIFFPPEGAIIEGSNGSGKTNLLESIYLLCTGKSQRCVPREQIINHESKHSFAEGLFISNESNSKSVSIGFDRGKKVVLKIDNYLIPSFSQWFGNRPIVSFSPDDLDVIRGGPEQRRKFIDLISSQIDDSYFTFLLQYRYNLACRNKILNDKFDKIQCSIYEEKMIESGTYLILKRQEIIKVLSDSIRDFYSEISGGAEDVSILYEPSIKSECSSKENCKNVFYIMLNEHRKKDIEMGFSSIGPHRDEIQILLDKKPAKYFGSRGQCRSLALSLKLSSTVCMEKYLQEKIMFLVDDALSELDPQRTSRVYPLIENKGQIFIATPSICDMYIGRKLMRCHISEGRVEIDE